MSSTDITWAVDAARITNVAWCTSSAGIGAKSPVWIVIGSCRVRQKDDPVVAKHRVPRRGLAAVLGSGPRNDDGIDSPLPQDNVEVRAKKSAVSMLLDNMFADCRRQLRVDLHARRAINQCVTIGDRRMHVIKESHIAPVTAVHVRRVDDFDSGLAADSQRLG